MTGLTRETRRPKRSAHRAGGEQASRHSPPAAMHERTWDAPSLARFVCLMDLDGKLDRIVALWRDPAPRHRRAFLASPLVGEPDAVPPREPVVSVRPS
jgi:hypothetical protein